MAGFEPATPPNIKYLLSHVKARSVLLYLEKGLCVERLARKSR